MSIGSLKDLYLDELADLYDAETQMIRTLFRLADLARAPELRDALTRHHEESRLHLERLELVFTHWGERRCVRPCAGLAGIVQEADDRLEQVSTDDARDAAIIGVAQRIEHYEMAAYGCARTYARRLNRTDEARLLQETLDEEGRADRRLTEIAEAHINDDARLEGDLGYSRVARLRYIGAQQAADASAFGPVGQSNGALSMRNDEGDDLGTFDGLLVDPASSRARYVVVKGGGLLASRRYLLPASVVRFEKSTQTLRVALTKDMAERYPPFDAHRFDAMTERDLEAFDARLAGNFPESSRSSPARPAGEPEWLMTGAWVTVPPDRVERLSDEARTFANPFMPDRPAAEKMVARDAAEASTPKRNRSDF
jgi:ferritin-like metal-binding protein YciE